jgi:hypothetical protein
MPGNWEALGIGARFLQTPDRTRGASDALEGLGTELAGSGNDMALAKGFFGETPERTLFGALVGGGGDALEGLGRSVRYSASSRQSHTFGDLLRSC